ncbi:LysM peptidoglycan-binding domain-containing protein [Geobacter sulfurreducens]|uniref:LysM peptidoglycan-binding domain-containing protein n=1 Tax=Geobacter sulfurreducens TaxID=35554 RepID=UPI0020B82710|nr:LysM peptidoglycan-binding domain-containing protein [Geobacter sulfurreducens]UTG92568.1 LysM peptidoglycan-binding domain-containing protein [Geobacter sulfurreducens]
MNTCHFYRVQLLRASLLLMAISATASASATSFELDVKDLQTVAPAKRAPKRKAPAPAASAETKRDTVPAETKRGVSRYTVKPGDFIFKILMREYGLSNAAAEALIPEIQRINNLRSITRLSVGQTILIPLEGPRAAVRVQEFGERRETAEPAATVAVAPPTEPSPQVVESGPAPPSEQAAPPVTEAAAPVPPRPEPAPATHPAEAAPPISPAPVVVSAPSSFSRRLITLWQSLVPGQERVEPITLNGRVLPPEEFPLLLAADGGKILVDMKGTLLPRDKSTLAERHPDIRLVSRGASSERDFFTVLLRTAEFAHVEEDAVATIGSDPQLTVKADYRITRLPAVATRGPENVFLFLERNGSCLPAALISALADNGINSVEFCDVAPQPPSVPGYELRSVTGTTPCELAVQLLGVLAVKLDRNRIVSGSMGENAESRFSIRVEGYFENDGKKFILSCNDNDSYNYTLFRLLQLEGYGIIQLGDKDDFATVADKILTVLRYPHSFGRHDFTHDRYTVSALGFRVTRLGPVSGRMLIIDRPVDPAFAELLQWER